MSKLTKRANRYAQISVRKDPNYRVASLLKIFGTSNLADIKDLEEDKNNGINTWPVVLGKEKSAQLSIGSILISTILVFINKRVVPLIKKGITFWNHFLIQASTSFVLVEFQQLTFHKDNKLRKVNSN